MPPRQLAATAAALVAAAVVAWFALSAIFGGEDERGGAPAKVLVRTVDVRMQSESVNLDAVGTARAQQSVQLYPEVEGVVTAVTMTAGKVVDAGTVLVRLESAEQDAAVSRGKVQVQAAQQLLDRYSRAQPGAVPATEIDVARTSLQEARLVLDQAEVALKRRVIRAPFRGTVGLSDVDVGDRVEPSTVIATFDDLSALLVDFVVPEQFLGRIKEGDRLALKPWVADVPEATGEVVGLDARVDPASGTFRARARVDNAEDRLRGGMSFRVNLALTGRAYPVVPEAAIIWGASGALVWQVRDGKAREVPLVIVQRSGGEVLVEADLKAGDLVVYEGVQRMRPGLAVDHEPAQGAPVPERAPAARING